MRDIILPEDKNFNRIDVVDVNTLKDAIVGVHKDKGGVMVLTTEDLQNNYSDYVWKVTNGNRLFGCRHKTIEQAIKKARENGYKVKLLTKEDFNI